MSTERANIPNEPELKNNLRKNIELGQASIEIVYEDPTVFQQIKSNYLNSEYALIINGNHQSHADIFAQILLNNEIIKTVNDNGENFKLKGMDMVIALSLMTGHQNQNLKNYFNEIEEYCYENNIDFIPLVRPQDEARYGLLPDSNLVLLRKALYSYKKQKILMEFPEGTIMAGRIDPKTGLHYGAQKTSESNITDNCIKMYNSKGVNFGILPVATDGSYQIFDADNYQFHIPEKKIKVTVGKLLKPDNFNQLSNGIRPTDIVMLQIIRHLSPENQGSYYPSLQNNVLPVYRNSR